MQKNWNAETCLLHDWGNLTETGNQCPSIWDGFTCWEPTANGTTASSRCPDFKGSDVTKFAHRICSPLGEWQGRYEGFSLTGWTNYTLCLTPEIREVMRKLGSNDDAQSKFNIAVNTRLLEFVGLSLSLVALLLSLLIFYYFRSLRNSRTKLHRHLFFAMVIQVAIRLIVYTDQAITRSAEDTGNSDGVYNASTYLSPYNSEGHDGEIGMKESRRGIDNTPILCEASYICLEYARTAMFMWMFVEGLFLHNMITVHVFEERISPVVYPIIGWIVPIPLTVAWAVVTHLHYGKATCWWGYNLTSYFWILEGPRLVVLMINLVFLLNILRVLITKLKKSNSSDMQQARKAVKAALVLLPLLGLTNLLNMLDAPLEKSPFQFALWSYTTHLLTSTQGLLVAFLYCFKNGEVQSAVRKFIRVKVLGNRSPAIFNRKCMPISVALKESIDSSNNTNSGFENIPSQIQHNFEAAEEKQSKHSTKYSGNHTDSLDNTSENYNTNSNTSSRESSSSNCSHSMLSLPTNASTGTLSSVTQSLSNGFLMQIPVLDKSVLQKLINRYASKSPPVNLDNQNETSNIRHFTKYFLSNRETQNANNSTSEILEQAPNNQSNARMATSSWSSGIESATSSFNSSAT